MSQQNNPNMVFRINKFILLHDDVDSSLYWQKSASLKRLLSCKLFFFRSHKISEIRVECRIEENGLEKHKCIQYPQMYVNPLWLGSTGFL